MMNKGKILVVDDNSGIRAALKILLPKYFNAVELLASPAAIHACLRDFRPDVVLLDMNFETDTNTGNEGLFWLSEIKRISSQTEVVLFTAYADIALAVEGMKRGAFDFIVKPWDNEKLVSVLQAACDKVVQKSGKTGKTVAKETESSTVAKMYWGEGPVMSGIRRTVEKIAPTEASVLITGENGTGKDVLAAEIHRLSDRGLKPMVCVDAGAITETLFESELFGSTLFLDEIGNIPLHLQAKLLRVLQNRSVTKVGDTHPVPVDIRLICATNKNLEEMVRNGTFREDLYYRINTIRLELPPLRERQDEILPLAKLFIARYAEKYHRPVTGMTGAAEKLLVSSRWNGNIRELQNGIEKAVILADGELLDVGDFHLSSSPVSEAEASQGEETLEMVEERAIRAAMSRFNGNLTHVAKSLNISRPTLYAKLKKYNI